MACLEPMAFESWLSREGVLAVAVMAALFAWFVHIHDGAVPPLWASSVVLVLIVATVYATSMIYASPKNSCAVASSVDTCLLSDVCGSRRLARSSLAAGDDWPACDRFRPAIDLAVAGSGMGCKAGLVAGCGAAGSGSSLASASRPPTTAW